MKTVTLLMTLVLTAVYSTASGDELEDRSVGAWLGVQLTRVPAAVASHLKLNDEGLMVRNVFEHTPAAEAGLEHYDVIIQVDGEPADEGVAGFSRHMGKKHPEDKLSLKVYRKGEPRQLTVQLAQRPSEGEWDELELMYETDPDVAHSSRFGFRGRILRPGPDGWILEDVGEIPELRDLPHWFDHFGEHHHGDDLPDIEGRKVDKEGQVLHVHRDQNGRIVVKRYQESESESTAEVKSHENMGDLRTADKEAHDLLHDAHPELESGRWLRPGRPLLDFFKPPLESRGRSGRRQHWRNRFFQEPLQPSPHTFRDPHHVRPQPAPRTHFDVDADGRISVHVRDCDTERNLTFPNEEEFQRKASDLHERYRAMGRTAR